MSSSSLVHRKCSYQGHYPLPNPMSIVWFILPHLSAASHIAAHCEKKKKALILFPLGFQTTTLFYFLCLSDHHLSLSLTELYMGNLCNYVNVYMLGTPKYSSPVNSRLMHSTVYSSLLGFLISMSEIMCHTPNPPQNFPSQYLVPPFTGMLRSKPKYYPWFLSVHHTPHPIN